MISKMKALGLVLAAAFAVSAVAASTASAEETEGMTPGHFFSHAENGKTHIHGQQVGENNVFTITDDETGTEGGEELATVKCPNQDVSFTGTPSDTEGNTEQASTFTDVAVEPTYSPETTKNCPAEVNKNPFGKAIVHTEGCKFVLSAHTDANEHAPVHIVCPPGNQITITAALECKIHIPPQTPDAGVHYETHGGTTASEEEAVLVHATVREIEYTTTAPCPLPREGNHADYDSTITVEGYEDLTPEGETTGPQTSITWTETAE